MAGTTIRVGIVEDDSALREALRRVVGWPGRGLSVVACCGTGKDLLDQVEHGAALDVAVVDLKLPDLPGIEVIARLRALSPAAVAVAFTVLDQPETVLAAIRAGARGYLLKSASPVELLAGIRAAAAGGAPMTPVIARLVVETLAGSTTLAELPDLAPREREVLELLAGGATYVEIATKLGIGHGTVQGYVKTLYRKLEVSSKAEAAALAVKHGIVT